VKIDDTCASDDSCITSCDTGQRLKLLRELAGLSQRELAKRAGLTNSSISTIEQGRVSPSIQSLTRILSALPISLSDFFSFELPLIPTSKRANLPAGIDAHTLVLPAQSAHAFLVAKGDICGAVLKGELLLLINAQEHRLVQGDTFYIAQNQLFRYANTASQELQIFICSQVSPAF
jgi:transcriptional regulator with XRE-family HTH domain